MWIGYFQITFSLFLKTNIDAHSLTWKWDSATCKINSYCGDNIDNKTQKHRKENLMFRIDR